MDNQYHHSKIYKLINPHTDKIYIGSTIQQYLANRMTGHRRDYKNWKSGKDRKHASSCFIFDTSDNIHDTKIELIEEFKCETKKELWNREMEIINQHENCVNESKGQCIDEKEYFKRRYERLKQDPEFIKKRKDYNREHHKQAYKKQKEDPEWVKKNRERAKKWGRKKRAEQKSNCGKNQ